jgi:peptidyl-prolyl cis-trans isomerase SurA
MLTIKYKYQIMPIKKIQMKSVNSKIALCFFFTAFKYDYEHKKLLKRQCNCSCQESAINQRQKIDGIVATVGNYIVLDSDIDKSYLEFSSQGGSIKTLDANARETIGR